MRFETEQTPSEMSSLDKQPIETAEEERANSEEL